MGEEKPKPTVGHIKPIIKDQLYDSIYIKCPEQANLQRQMSEMITKKHSYFRGDKIDSDDGCIKSVNTLKIIKLSDLNW